MLNVLSQKEISLLVVKGQPKKSPSSDILTIFQSHLLLSHICHIALGVTRGNVLPLPELQFLIYRLQSLDF